MPEDIIGRCWHCGAALTKVDFGRETNCLGCGKPTRCCRNCRFYQRGRPNDCIEPMAEQVSDKERATFCGFFDPSPTPVAIGEAGSSSTDALRQAADDLFKH
jgi:hypothetical protein